MSEQNEKFSLENLDQAIEELVQGDPSLPEVRLLQDLQQAHKTRDSIVAHATERVWQRLLAGERSGRTREREAYSLPSVPFQPSANHPQKGAVKMKYFDKPETRLKRQGRSLFSGLAAVLLAGILVSAFVILTQPLHKGQPATKPQPQTGSSPAFLYVDWAGGVTKLDKQSGKVLWTFSAPDRHQLQSPLGPIRKSKITLSTENTVYLTNSSVDMKSSKTTFTLHEYALNAHDGSLRWSYTSQGDMAPGSSVLSGNILYIVVDTGIIVQITGQGGANSSSTGSSLLALDTQNGHLLWRTPLKGIAGGSPTVNNGLVYVGIADGGYNSTAIHGIEALDARSGALAWSSLTPGTAIQQSPFQVTGTQVYDFLMEPSASTDDLTITTVQAFDALTGKVRWNSTPITGVIITAVTPTLVNGVIYFCANFGSEAKNIGKIFALDAASGQQLQVYDSLPLELYELLPLNGHIYLSYGFHGGPDPSISQVYGSAGLLALDMKTHQRLWLDSDINGDNAFPSSLLLENGLLYFLANGQVEAANSATGAIIWQQDLSQDINRS